MSENRWHHVTSHVSLIHNWTGVSTGLRPVCTAHDWLMGWHAAAEVAMLIKYWWLLIGWQFWCKNPNYHETFIFTTVLNVHKTDNVSYISIECTSSCRFALLFVCLKFQTNLTSLFCIVATCFGVRFLSGHSVEWNREVLTMTEQNWAGPPSGYDVNALRDRVMLRRFDRHDSRPSWQFTTTSTTVYNICKVLVV